MKLIADSGSTKTSWHLFATSPHDTVECKTSGINPFFQTSDEILQTLLSEYSLPLEGITSVYFYGAGAANEIKKKELYVALHKFFNIKTIHIESDLLAAAHSLCGNEPGIAAVLGTGSNSCYYDGKNIVQHVSPLGYVLGDEGSGAVLGRKLLGEVLKNQLPHILTQQFFDTYKLTSAEIIENVYRKPFPNRFMASFTRFLSSNIHEPSMHALVLTSFIEFYKRNIAQYSQFSKLQVNFTGSIAWHFSTVLTEAALKSGFTVGKITLNPMQGLIDFHNKSFD